MVTILVIIGIAIIGIAIIGAIVLVLLIRLGKLYTAKSATDDIVNGLKGSLGDISLEVLNKCGEPLLTLMKEKLGAERELGVKDLDEKKKLIDQQLENMNTELTKVSTLVKEFEKDRAEKFGMLANQLKTTGEQTAMLIETTSKLREVLASARKRGEWGQRMADDVLRVAGFVENVNYVKQKAIVGIGTIPDYTFLLPRELKLNMDVKFPLDNYANYVNADSDIEKDGYRIKFLRDVRGHLKAVTSRDYINPQQNTVDYVLLFIPNEQIYSFIHEQDSSILDEGLKNKVIFCSPITLFIVLAVIRAAIDNFALEKASKEIASLYGTFNRKWEMFRESLNKLGERLRSTLKECDYLTTTRLNELERPLRKIENLRTQRGLPVADEDEISATGEDAAEEGEGESENPF